MQLGAVNRVIFQEHLISIGQTKLARRGCTLLGKARGQKKEKRKNVHAIKCRFC